MDFKKQGLLVIFYLLIKELFILFFTLYMGYMGFFK